LESSANEARYFGAQRCLRHRRTLAPATRLSHGARRHGCSRRRRTLQLCRAGLEPAKKRRM